MKKTYTITPDQYREKQSQINNIGYKNGWYDYETNKYRLSDSTPERTRERFEKLTKECEEMPIPSDKTFFLGTDIYNLWLNRDTDEPITARELYNIIASISEEIKDAESSAKSSAAWSNWDGH